MSLASEWLWLNGFQIRVNAASTGTVQTVTSTLRIAYERDFPFIGAWRSAVCPDARKVGLYAYTPVVPGDGVGPRTFVSAIGTTAPIPDHSTDMLMPQAEEVTCTGSFTNPEHGTILVWHFLNQDGQVLGKSIVYGPYNLETTHDSADVVHGIQQTIIDSTSSALSAAATSLLDQIASWLGITRAQATILVGIVLMILAVIAIT